jgi:tetratricopeptide (TPR) repeat protein
VKVLATSRERLNLHGESLFTIQGMDFPDWEAPENTLEYSAVKLFLQSARRAQPGYELAPNDLPYLARICRLVRGMPLGIELAAAWADTLRLDEIAAEIEGSLDFLETEMRDAPERHRSIRAVFEYSWSLLADDERAVFIKLSVFRGGFTRDAAMTISGASLRNLTALVNKSLLARDPNGRYQIHELLRQYAEERLQQSDQADAIYNAHCVYYADLIGSMYDDFAKMADQTLIKLTLIELDNMRAALRWAVDHERLTESRSFILPLIIIAQLRGLYLEGVEGLERVQAMLKRLELTIEVQEADLVASIMLGWLYMRFGDIAKSKSVLEHGCELMEVVQPPIGAEEPFSALGMIHSIMGDYQTATQLAERGLAFNRSRDDDGSSMLSFYTLTSAAFGQGDYVAAKAYSEQALVCTEKVNQRWFAAYVHIDLGNIARVMGDYAAARHHYQTCYDIRKEYGDPEGMAVSLKNLGRVATLEGDPKEAKRLYEESLVLYKDIGDRGGLATTYTGLGAALCALGEFEAAQAQLRRGLKIAADTHILPLLLSVLAGFGELLAQYGDSDQGFEILGLILHHASSSHETKEEVRAMLERFENASPSALERGAKLELNAVVQELLAD